MLSRAPGDMHGRAAAQIEAGGGAGAIRRDFEMAGAAEQRAHLAVVGIGIGRDHARHRVVSTYADADDGEVRSEEHTSELQSHVNLVCRLLLEKKKWKMSAPK